MVMTFYTLYYYSVYCSLKKNLWFFCQIGAQTHLGKLQFSLPTSTTFFYY